MFCPACGAERLRCCRTVRRSDFVCACAEEFELKAKKDALGRSIPDGTLGAMTVRLTGRINRSLFAMSYDRDHVGGPNPTSDPDAPARYASPPWSIAVSPRSALKRPGTRSGGRGSGARRGRRWRCGMMWGWRTCGGGAPRRGGAG
ncbi:hypothetical protein E4M02_03335 [Brevundimonas sp. S30B]|nr:hypothetical protein E4M01_04480 [Brevundimonas sp. MF30-B]TFW04118.1 hypothetical protein E4M02_03335 [Brevundimonas sp. S30B]